MSTLFNILAILVMAAVMIVLIRGFMNMLDELTEWAARIKASGAKRAWVYFNNDHEGHAPKNATTLRSLLETSA